MSIHTNLKRHAFTDYEDLSSAILDHLAIPILLVASDRSVQYMNTAGRTLVEADNAVVITNSILGTHDAADTERLKVAVASTCANRSGRVVVLGGKDAPLPLVALILPFGTPAQAEHSRALVLLRTAKEVNDVLTNSLRRLFRLSPAEASIAAALGTGMDLNELAQQRQVKLNTLRSQVASIMAKTGTRRQAQLVALVARIDSVL